MDDRAAVKCSERMRSTVSLKAGDLALVDDMLSALLGDSGSKRGEDELRARGLSKGDCVCEAREDKAGVICPGVPEPEGLLVRWRASLAARRRRLVVPSALVEPDRAEHTMATLCWSM